MITVGFIAMGIIVCVDLVIFLKAISVLFYSIFFSLLEINTLQKKPRKDTKSIAKRLCQFSWILRHLYKVCKRQSRLLAPYGIICKLPLLDEARVRATNKKVEVALPFQWSLTIDTWEIKHDRITLRNDGQLGRAHYNRICTVA